MKRDQKGIAIIIALLTILILSTLGAAIIFSTQGEITTTTNYRRLTQARYAAEAGAQKTINWIIYNYNSPASYSDFNMALSPVQCAAASSNCTPGMPIVLSALSGTTANYPFSGVQTAFNAALANQAVSGLDVGVNFSTTATLKTLQLAIPLGISPPTPIVVPAWLIRSQATLSGSQAQVEVTTTIEKIKVPVFSYAAYAANATCAALTLGGGATTDSFDSSAGTYAATHQSSGGNVGTNGNINLIGSTTVVNGIGSTPNSTTPGTCSGSPGPGLTTSGGATITGGLTMLSSPGSFPDPVVSAAGSGTQTLSNAGDCMGLSPLCSIVSGNMQLMPGQYGNLTLTGNNTVHLSAGVYNIASLLINGNNTLVIDGPVVLNIVGTGDLTGGTFSNTISGKASDLQIIHLGSQALTLNGGANSYGVVYAPHAAVTINGGADWYGSVVGQTVAATGGAKLHYDRNLGNLPLVVNYRQTAFAWSKY